MGRKSNKSKKNKDNLPSVHPQLAGFNITINEFGEINSNFEIERLNQFLNENLTDKKLKNNVESESQSENQSENQSESNNNLNNDLNDSK